MGSTLTAMLFYGYCLGSEDGDNGWRIEEYDQTTGFNAEKLPWLEVDENGDVEDFPEKLNARRMALSPRPAVFLEEDGTIDWGRYFLVAGSLDNISREEFTGPELDHFLDRAELEGWNIQLAEAIEALGVHPTQAEPRWFLAASYS